MNPAVLTVLILTKNEERHIARALRALRHFPATYEVFVVDSGSNDQTVPLARQNGATVVEHQFRSHADQVNWSLDSLPIRTPWVLRLDADEILYPDVLANLAEAISASPTHVKGLLLNRRHIFQGRWVRHGGRFPLWMLRAWRVGAAHAEVRWMDEHMVLDGGTTRKVGGRFEDRSLLSIDEFVAKHNRYASLEAIDRLYTDHSSAPLAGWRNRFKRTVKRRVYNKLPRFSGPTLYFLWRMTFGLGFLDGPSGIVYHFLQGFWYRLVVELKVAELKALVTGDLTAEITKRVLADATGIDVSIIDGRLPKP